MSDDDIVVFQAARAGKATLVQHIWWIETDLRKRRRGAAMLAMLQQGQKHLRHNLDESTLEEMDARRYPPDSADAWQNLAQIRLGWNA
eukprot:10063790-Alexandrium_andersonii.AAC.1